MVDEKGGFRSPRHHGAQVFAAGAPRLVEGRVLCIGGAAVDVTFVARRSIVPGTSNPAISSRSFGGVARNVAENLARLGVSTALLSRIGDDENGLRLKRHLESLGVDTAGVEIVPGSSTAEYMALLEPDRNLSVGVADMAIFDGLDDSLLQQVSDDGSWIFVDCNCTPAFLERLLHRPTPFVGRIAVDAVSVAKAGRLPASLEGLDILFLNLDEAASILQSSRSSLAPHSAVRGLRDKGAKSVVLTLGRDGVLVGEATGEPVHVPAVPAEVADVTGAGDALVATTLAAILVGSPLPIAAGWGCIAASLTLERIGSARTDLSFARLEDHARQHLPLAPETRP